MPLLRSTSSANASQVPASSGRVVRGNAAASGCGPGQQPGELGRPRQHGPVARIDVHVRHVLGPGEFGHFARRDPLPRLVRAELGTDDGDGHVEPPLVAQVDDPLGHAFGDRNRLRRERALRVLVEVDRVRPVEWLPPREGHHAVVVREEVGVGLAIRRREPTDEGERADLVGTGVGGHPRQRARRRVPDDEGAAGRRVDVRDHGGHLVPRGPVEPETTDQENVHPGTVRPVPDDLLPVSELSWVLVLHDASPTARALQTLVILQTRPGTTAGELGERLDVTERAARRYVAILREAGIPVESSRGPYGGYRLGRGARLPPVVFTAEEALGLVMAVLGGHPAATDPGDLVGSALSKVVRVLPERVGRQAAALRDYASTVPDRYASDPDPAVTGALVAAVAARRRVALRYRSRPGHEWDADVDPWAVVARHGHWYLLCHSHRAGAVRTYRVDRISRVDQTSHGFVPPEDLDPVASLEEHLGAGWEFPTRVTFDAPLEEVRPWIRSPMGRLEADGDGCLLIGSTNNPTMYAQEWLAAMPFAFRVHEGPELRAAVASLAARCAAAVGELVAV